MSKFSAPKVFALAFSIAKKFMNEYTISKIQIYKADPVKWKAAILQVIPQDQLPVHFGGTLMDSDDNPKLTSKVFSNFFKIFLSSEFRAYYTRICLFFLQFQSKFKLKKKIKIMQWALFPNNIRSIRMRIQIYNDTFRRF